MASDKLTVSRVTTAFHLNFSICIIYCLMSNLNFRVRSFLFISFAEFIYDAVVGREVLYHSYFLYSIKILCTIMDFSTMAKSVPLHKSVVIIFISGAKSELISVNVVFCTLYVSFVACKHCTVFSALLIVPFIPSNSPAYPLMLFSLSFAHVQILPCSFIQLRCAT